MKSQPCLWFRRQNILKWPYTQINQQIQHNPHKILSDFYAEIDNTFIRVISFAKEEQS